MSKEIYYSDKYEDDKYEYRHVMLPKVGIFSYSPFSVSKNTPDNQSVDRPLPNLCPRRTACLSRSGETLASSRVLGEFLKLHCLKYQLFAWGGLLAYFQAVLSAHVFHEELVAPH